MKSAIYLLLPVLFAVAGPATGQVLGEPAKVSVANDSSPVIQLEFDTTAFPELAIYNHLSFQIDPHGRKFDSADAREIWEKVEIRRAGDEPGIYLLSFSNANRRVAYRARPVVGAADDAAAEKAYEAREQAYRHALQKKEAATEQIDKEFLLAAVELEKIGNVDERNARYDSLVATTRRKLAKLAFVNIDPTQPVRSHTRNGPATGRSPEEAYQLVPVAARYRDSLGRLMQLTNVDVLFRDVEVLGYRDGSAIRVAANGDNMIFGIWEHKLYVLPFDAYHRLRIGPGTRAVTFPMEYADTVTQDLRYFDLRNLIEKYEQQHR